VKFSAAGPDALIDQKAPGQSSIPQRPSSDPSGSTDRGDRARSDTAVQGVVLSSALQFSAKGGFENSLVGWALHLNIVLSSFADAETGAMIRIGELMMILELHPAGHIHIRHRSTDWPRPQDDPQIYRAGYGGTGLMSAYVGAAEQVGALFIISARDGLSRFGGGAPDA